MKLAHVVLLAIVEGLTEFLPVSSTGHMIIVSTLLGIASAPFVKVFTVAIQLGAILSVVVLYLRRFFQNLRFYLRLIVAVVPALAAGALLKRQIDALLESVFVVAGALAVGGIAFVALDGYFKRSAKRSTTVDDITLPCALRIGLFQVLALVPGVSRSAATIIGGLTQGLSPTTAAEFSFFLAVPTMCAATAKSLLDYIKAGTALTSHEATLLGVGNLVAFVVALVAIRAFVTYLTRHGFFVFGVYRIIAGLVVAALALRG